MLRKRLNTLYAGAGALVGLAALAVPASVGSAADMIAAPTLTYDLAPIGSMAPDGDAPISSATAGLDPVATSEAPSAIVGAKEPAFDSPSHVCVAKIVLHEAGNQPRAGKVAVAQTLVNRLGDGRFGDTICEVANQPGQFFDLSRYNPRRDSLAWADAMDVAEEVLSGESDVVAPGAMFFRASYAPSNSFFRGRRRVAAVGAHVFYR
jgi:N-acetylmuramoyl-L-alanine amidase